MSETLRIAAVYAHPDDGEFFAAGTLAKWAAAGHTVYALCATRGDLGSKRRDVTRDDLAATRAAELGRALHLLGAQPPILLGFPDGFLRDHAAALRERLIYWFRRLRIDRVLTFDPWKRYEIHPDHIEAGRIASEAAVFSCFPLLHPEHLCDGVDAAQPKEVWYMMPTEHRPNRIIDISATFQKKVASVLSHSSQIEMLADWFVKGANPQALTDEQRAQLQQGTESFLDGMARGVAGMAPGIERAEAFFAQPVGPGHFQNYQELFMEAAGVPPAPPQLG
ncbi:MAG: PIG-L family deacetylase [Myxococcales bacterium]|nr:PIG-L family deacetylase [Myxococcales bacterium]